jgi:hypothetical protein
MLRLNYKRDERRMEKDIKCYRRHCFVFVLMALFLATTLFSSLSMSANALKKYGYKEGDDHRFVVETSTTIKTEEGTTLSSRSYEVIYKIKEIDEDVNGYDIKIKLVVVGSRGFYPGFYGYGSLMDEITIEGNKLMPEDGGFYPRGIFNLFTSTDWSDREDEWDDFIEKIDDQEGYKVEEDSASNGVFSLRVELDVDDDHATAIDYDGDGKREGYTGWWTFRGEYDDKGVLKASSWESYMEFDRRNSVKSSFNVYRGPPAMLPREMFIYVALVVVSFGVAFVSGFFLGKRRVSKEAGVPATDVSAKASTKHCIHCGEEISLDAVFCMKCGKKQ